MLRSQQRVGDVLNLLRAACLSAALALILVACGGQDPQRPPVKQRERPVVAHAVAPSPVPDEIETPDATVAVTAEPPAAAPASKSRPKSKAGETSASEILSASDLASFDRLAVQLGGEHGLAISGLGRGRQVEHVGSLNSVIAWSTAKVPIAMAVIDAGGQSDQQSNLTAAITASDNAAATRLWASLGSPQQAAAAVESELRRTGDQHTRIQSQTLRPGLTPFGQTSWSLSDQARFVAAMPCSAAGQAVLALMGRVISSQRWGLGSAGVQADLKGGWGPGSQPGHDGGYLTRQMGILRISGKPIAVTLASLPQDGSYESGVRDLTAIARWLVSRADVKNQPPQAAC